MIRHRRRPHAIAAAGLLLAASGCADVRTADAPAPVEARPPGGGDRGASDARIPEDAVFVASGAVEAWAADMEQDCPPPSQGGAAFFATLYAGGTKALTLTVADRDGTRGALLEDHRTGLSYVAVAGITLDPVAGAASVDADFRRTDGAPGTAHVTARVTCP
ncbi:hypothetical protein GCM10022221_78310 [Actinocorallia aurea]